MRYLIFLGHPAHFHLFKNIVSELKRKGHDVKLLIRSKDILEQLCVSSGIEFVNVLPETRNKTSWSIIISYLKKYKRISKIIREFKPNLLMGSEPSLAHLGKFFNIPSFIFSEDDAAIIPQFAKIAYPFVDVILSPQSCNAGKWEYKKIGYNGFHKLAYLHPEVFTPNENELEEIIGKGDYFILRFAELNAYHDTNKEGINNTIAKKIIELLKPHGNIYISSERILDPELEKYRININPLKVHHLMYHAKMYIGDSQSMAVEAALLGTPGIRFNDFAREIGVLNELEQKYLLTNSFKTKQENELMNQILNMLVMPDLKKVYAERRKIMLNDKINVFKFFIWFIENYPSSQTTMQQNPNYQYNFK